MTGGNVHVEPFIHLVEVAHDCALVGIGAFWFRQLDDHGRWEIVDDEQLEKVAGRKHCVGSQAEPYGHLAVEVLDASGEIVARADTKSKTWTWVEGLQPETDYRYRVMVDGDQWAAGECWDWVPSERGGYDLAPAGRRYDLRFRTWPEPTAVSPRLQFAALGDYGVGIRSDSESSRRQRRIAEALEKIVDDHDVQLVVSLGDTIYQGEQGQVDDESGGEDDDWYSSFFQPYRYVISRVPVYPTVGNHDADDTEGSDDRAQMEDNFHTQERFQDTSGRASVTPGLFYKLPYGRDIELICLDSSMADPAEHVHRHFQDPKHVDWLNTVFTPDDVLWRIPFSHHPVYCAGPSHVNDDEMLESLVPLFDRSDVRLVLAGHEHNFQVSTVGDRTYVVSGAGGKLREGVPEHFKEAHTWLWAEQSHLLLIDIDGESASLTPVSGLLENGELHLMTAMTTSNEIVYPPITVRSPR